MVFKGTESRTARKLSIELEDYGAQVNACTSEDQTVYDARGDAEGLPILADILCDMVWRSTFPAQELELEREVIGEEITMYRETPSDHISDLISSTLWHGHPLGHAIAGDHESLAELKREQLCEFRDRHHLREDLVISAAGPFDWKDVADLLDPLLPRCSQAPAERLTFDPDPWNQRHIIEERETEQTQLSIAWHSPGRSSQDRHALRLLSLMLGETAGSRLFLELREELGLCYQISSEVTLFDETGALEIHAGLDPSSTDEARQRIEDQLGKFAREGPLHGELERAKKLAVVNGKTSMETTTSHALWAGESLLDFGRIPPQHEWQDHILAVSGEDVRAIAQRLVQAPPAIAEIRPL